MLIYGLQIPIYGAVAKLVKTLASPSGEARADSDLVNSGTNCDLFQEMDN